MEGKHIAKYVAQISNAVQARSFPTTSLIGAVRANRLLTGSAASTLLQVVFRQLQTVVFLTSKARLVSNRGVLQHGWC